MRLKLITLGILIILSVLLALAFYLHTSLYYIWSITPEGGIKFALDNKKAPLLLADKAYSYLPPEISALAPKGRKISYSHSEEADTVAILPKNYIGAGVSSSLTQSHWHVKRQGLLIVASTSPPQIKSPLFLSRQAIKYFLSKKNSNNPSAIAYLPSQYTSLGHPLALAAFDAPSHNLIKVAVSDSFLHLPDINKRESIATDGNNNRLYIAVHSDILKLLPDNVSANLNNLLRQKYQLAKVKPDIIGFASDSQSTIIDISNDHMGFAAQGDSLKFLSTLENWLRQEDTRTRLAKKAFKLPDGTLGYEIIPGPPRQLFNFTINSNGCRAPLENRSRYWLCRQGDMASLATSKERALQLLKEVQKSTWLVQIGSDYTREILPQIKFLTASGAGKTAIITISY